MKWYVLNRATNVYYDGKCPYVVRISKSNIKRVDYDEVIKQGFTACKHCRTMKYIFKQ